MSDVAGTGLREPEQMDWENYNPGSKYRRPPVPVDEAGKTRTMYGVVPQEIGCGVSSTGYRNYDINALRIVKTGGDADGYDVRTWASVKKFSRNGKTIEASTAGNFLRAAGILAKPQKNAEYDAAMKLSQGRTVPFVLDWRARNHETGEEVRGYQNFPDDPDSPGSKKAILKAGDTYTIRDNKGNITDTRTVESDVLFANGVVRYFVTAQG